mgnify:CR=1 FL=1
MLQLVLRDRLHQDAFELANAASCMFSDEGNDLLKQEGVLFIPILSGKQRRYFSILNIVDMFKLAVNNSPAHLTISCWQIYLNFSYFNNHISFQ